MRNVLKFMTVFIFMLSMGVNVNAEAPDPVEVDYEYTTVDDNDNEIVIKTKDVFSVDSFNPKGITLYPDTFIDYYKPSDSEGNRAFTGAGNVLNDFVIIPVKCYTTYYKNDKAQTYGGYFYSASICCNTNYNTCFLVTPAPVYDEKGNVLLSRIIVEPASKSLRELVSSYIEVKDGEGLSEEEKAENGKLDEIKALLDSAEDHKNLPDVIVGLPLKCLFTTMNASSTTVCYDSSFKIIPTYNGDTSTVRISGDFNQYIDWQVQCPIKYDFSTLSLPDDCELQFVDGAYGTVADGGLPVGTIEKLSVAKGMFKGNTITEDDKELIEEIFSKSTRLTDITSMFENSKINTNLDLSNYNENINITNATKLFYNAEVFRNLYVDPGMFAEGCEMKNTFYFNDCVNLEFKGKSKSRSVKDIDVTGAHRVSTAFNDVNVSTIASTGYSVKSKEAGEDVYTNPIKSGLNETDKTVVISKAGDAATAVFPVSYNYVIKLGLYDKTVKEEDIVYSDVTVKVPQDALRGLTLDDLKDGKVLSFEVSLDSLKSDIKSVLENSTMDEYPLRGYFADGLAESKAFKLVREIPEGESSPKWYIKVVADPTSYKELYDFGVDTNMEGLAKLLIDVGETYTVKMVSNQDYPGEYSGFFDANSSIVNNEGNAAEFPKAVSSLEKSVDISHIQAVQPIRDFVGWSIAEEQIDEKGDVSGYAPVNDGALVTEIIPKDLGEHPHWVYFARWKSKKVKIKLIPRIFEPVESEDGTLDMKEIEDENAKAVEVAVDATDVGIDKCDISTIDLCYKKGDTVDNKGNVTKGALTPGYILKGYYSNEGLSESIVENDSIVKYSYMDIKKEFEEGGDGILEVYVKFLHHEVAIIFHIDEEYKELNTILSIDNIEHYAGAEEYVIEDLIKYKDGATSLEDFGIGGSLEWSLTSSFDSPVTKITKSLIKENSKVINLYCHPSVSTFIAMSLGNAKTSLKDKLRVSTWGEKEKFSLPSKKGYTFTGFTMDGEPFEYEETEPASDSEEKKYIFKDINNTLQDVFKYRGKEIVAHYELVPHVITYVHPEYVGEVTNENPTNVSVETNDSGYIDLKEPKALYYNFEGWGISEDEIPSKEFRISCVEDSTVYSAWSPKDLAIHYPLGLDGDTERYAPTYNYGMEEYPILKNYIVFGDDYEFVEFTVTDATGKVYHVADGERIPKEVVGELTVNRVLNRLTREPSTNTEEVKPLIKDYPEPTDFIESNEIIPGKIVFLTSEEDGGYFVDAVDYAGEDAEGSIGTVTCYYDFNDIEGISYSKFRNTIKLITLYGDERDAVSNKTFFTAEGYELKEIRNIDGNIITKGKFTEEDISETDGCSVKYYSDEYLEMYGYEEPTGELDTEDTATTENTTEKSTERSTEKSTEKTTQVDSSQEGKGTEEKATTESDSHPEATTESSSEVSTESSSEVTTESNSEVSTESNSEVTTESGSHSEATTESNSEVTTEFVVRSEEVTTELQSVIATDGNDTQVVDTTEKATEGITAISTQSSVASTEVVKTAISKPVIKSAKVYKKTKIKIQLKSKGTYQCEISLSKKFKKNKVSFYINNKKFATQKCIKKGKVHYVRVRQIVNVNGRRLMSKWSKTVKVKVKK